MAKLKNRLRRKPISYRVPVELEAEFDCRLERSGLSASAFLTQGWYGRPVPRQQRRPPVESHHLAKIMADCAKVRDCALAWINNVDDQTRYPIVERIHSELHLIRVALFELLGRKP